MAGIGALPEGVPEPKEPKADHHLEKHEIERHVGSLMEAEKIKADPDLMKALEPHIEKHKEAASKLGHSPVKSIEQLKAVAKKKLAQPE